MEKYGTTRQATENIILRMRIACWITKATDTLKILLYHDNSGYANAPQYYAIRTLPVMSQISPSKRVRALQSIVIRKCKVIQLQAQCGPEGG